MKTALKFFIVWGLYYFVSEAQINNIRWYKINLPFEADYISEIFADSNERIWLRFGKFQSSFYSEEKLGVLDKNSNQWEIYDNNVIPIMDIKKIKKIKENPNDNSIWFITKEGIIQYKNKVWQPAPLNYSIIPKQGINDIAFNSKGKCYYATSKGLIYENELGELKKNDSLTINLNTNFINCLGIDSKDNVYFANNCQIYDKNSGIQLDKTQFIKKHEDEFTFYETPLGIFKIVISRLDSVWLATYQTGHFRYPLWGGLVKIINEKKNIYYSGKPYLFSPEVSGLAFTSNDELYAVQTMNVSVAMGGTTYSDGTILYYKDGYFKNWGRKDFQIDEKSYLSGSAISIDEKDIVYIGVNRQLYSNQELVNNEQSEILKFTISQNFPNPFNPSTRIEYTVPELSMVKITVYDILGKEVCKLVDEEKSAGSYSVEFNGAGLSSGVYFYRININGYSETKKMLLLR